MKKILTLLLSAILVISCNAQAPQPNDALEKFATAHNLSTELRDKLRAAQAEIDAITAPIEQLEKDYTAATDQAQKEKISALYMEIMDKAIASIKKSIEENRDNAIPAYFIPQIMETIDITELKELCTEGTAYYDLPEMEPVKKYLATFSKRQPGEVFTDLEEADLDGQMHSLSEFVGHGNYVLIDFWASWCGPCRQEMPVVKAAYEKYHAKGFNVVGLSFDQKKDAWAKAVSDMQLNWVHLSDLKGWQSVAGEVYGIRSIPASILVDPEGKIIANDLRGEALGNKLAEIFGE